jgi:hypothetical protein
MQPSARMPLPLNEQVRFADVKTVKGSHEPTVSVLVLLVKTTKRNLYTTYSFGWITMATTAIPNSLRFALDEAWVRILQNAGYDARIFPTSFTDQLNAAFTAGILAVGAVGSAPNAAGASISGGTLTLQPADGSNPGVVTTSAQTLAGTKTFSSSLVSGAAQGASAVPVISAGTGAESVSLGGYPAASASGLYLGGDGTRTASNAVLYGTQFDVYLNTPSGSSASGGVFLAINGAQKWFLSNSTGGYMFAPYLNASLDLGGTANRVRNLYLSGSVKFDATDTSGTPGAATINKPSGQVSVASGASSVVVTNSLVATTSVVLAVLQDNTDAIQIRSVVPASGSFTINLSGVTTGARKVGFVVNG